MSQRLVRIAHPDLTLEQNSILHAVARWQGRDKPLKKRSIALGWRESLNKLIIDGWVAELENSDLVMDEADIMKYGIWREITDCGCGNA